MIRRSEDVMVPFNEPERSFKFIFRIVFMAFIRFIIIIIMLSVYSAMMALPGLIKRANFFARA